MPHRKGCGRRRHRRHHGGNIFEDVWNNVHKPAHNYIKDNKLVSKILKVIPHKGAQTIGDVAEKAGYGRRRRHHGGHRHRHAGHRKAILC